MCIRSEIKPPVPQLRLPPPSTDVTATYYLTKGWWGRSGRWVWYMYWGDGAAALCQAYLLASLTAPSPQYIMMYECAKHILYMYQGTKHIYLMRNNAFAYNSMDMMQFLDPKGLRSPCKKWESFGVLCGWLTCESRPVQIRDINNYFTCFSIIRIIAIVIVNYIYDAGLYQSIKQYNLWKM
jgi:hypothetical protein